MKKIVSILAVALVAMLSLSCQKENPSKFVGTWNVEYIEVTADVEGFKYSEKMTPSDIDEDLKAIRFTFKGNGAGFSTVIEKSGESNEEPMKWSYDSKSNTLSMMVDDDPEAMEAKVEFKGRNRMFLTMDMDLEDMSGGALSSAVRVLLPRLMMSSRLITPFA